MPRATFIRQAVDDKDSLARVLVVATFEKLYLAVIVSAIVLFGNSVISNRALRSRVSLEFETALASHRTEALAQLWKEVYAAQQDLESAAKARDSTQVDQVAADLKSAVDNAGPFIGISETRMLKMQILIAPEASLTILAIATDHGDDAAIDDSLSAVSDVLDGVLRRIERMMWSNDARLRVPLRDN